MDAVSAIGNMVSLTVGAIGGHWIPSLLGFHSREASFKATITELEKRLSQLASDANKRDEESQVKYAELQSKYDERFSDEAIRSKYVSNELTGTSLHEFKHYCSPCLLLSHPVESLLHSEGGYRKCHSCDKAFNVHRVTFPVGIT